MTTEQLQLAIRRRPFVPFTLNLADSRQVTIPHPENIAYAGGRTALAALPGERLEVIDLLLVVGLEWAETAQPAAGSPS